MMLPSSRRPSEILAQHRAEVIEIVARNKGSNICVFGSIVRGQDVAGVSDIDLLVTLDEGASLLDLAGMWGELTDLLGVEIDIETSTADTPLMRHIRATAQRL